MWARARYLEDVPNSCLRFEDNKFHTADLKGGSQVELHHKVRNYRPWETCWYDWQATGMNVTNLINYLRLEGPCDEYLLPTTSEEDALPPTDESADEGEAVNKGGNLKKVCSEEEEPMEE